MASPERAPALTPRMAQVLHVFGVLTLSCLLLPVSPTSPQSRQDLIHRLFERASAQQAKHDKSYIPIVQWFEQKGVYKSAVKLNFHGSPVLAESRRIMDVFDNNMFATAWVTSSLLEAFRLNRKTRPSNEQLASALNVIDSHRNKNSNELNASTFVFWQQRFNETTKYWESTPANLLSCFNLLNDLPLPMIESILRDLGLDALANNLEQIRLSEPGYRQAFHIPPDFDDTFVNLGLGSLLKDLSADFPEAWGSWKQANTNVISVFRAFKKYAYRPFSKDPNVNAIDPRTYYYLRDFLDKAAQQHQDVALVTTWVQNVDELRREYPKGVSMPLQVNNVDLTVAANTIYGLTSSILSGIFSAVVFDDKDVAKIFLNTSSLIAEMINNNITSRQDLALTYYPSEIEFDWFVSRTTSLMDKYLVNNTQLPHPVLTQAHGILVAALKGKMTQSVLSKGKQDQNGDIYYDDFLGNGDLTIDNKPLHRAEDRIFTTAMAANALMYTWTVASPDGGKNSWAPDTPAKVKDTVEGCVRWLSKHALDSDYKPWNAFFSGSFKGSTTLPYWYPANLYQHLNGSEVKDKNKYPKPGDRLAMSGYVDKPTYEKMVAQPHFNQTTPLIFHGYNSDRGWFPFWGSEAYTFSTTLITLVTYDSIQG